MPISHPPIQRLIVTPGEPAGIGGEILLGAIGAGARRLITFDNLERLKTIAAAMGVDLKAEPISSTNDAAALPDDCLGVLPITWPAPIVPGQPSEANAHTIIDTIKKGANAARNGEVVGLVTNPIQKTNLYAAGFDSPGHTEYLGKIDGKDAYPVMMLCSEMMKVVPLTIHIPINQVAAQITKERIERVGNIIDDALRRDFNINQPRIAVTGLNPHAGEGGHIGGEEEDIIKPALADLRKKSIHVDGPYPADSLFHEGRRHEYDAVLTMYHDQALIPLKTLDFFGGVNTTLGLSYIRTSPDHGTALDLAGQYKANPASLIAAIELAFTMARNRHKTNA